MARGVLPQSLAWLGSVYVAVVQTVSARNRFCFFVLWMTQDCLITELKVGDAVVGWDAQNWEPIGLGEHECLRPNATFLANS